MAKKRNKEMSVLKIHEILRLGLNESRSYREIARSCQVSLGAVSKYLARAKG
jgi:DNA-directed RNA polymerase specialized sigma24 family protein